MRSSILPAPIRFALIVPAALSMAACEGQAAPAERVETAEIASSPLPAEPEIGREVGTIDPDPVVAEVARIARTETITVQGEPACAFAIAYPGQIEQEATWRGESCETAPPTVLSVAALRDAGQLDDLPEEARRDIEAMTNGVAVVQSTFTASAYPLNVAGRVYEVPYAD